MAARVRAARGAGRWSMAVLLLALAGCAGPVGGESQDPAAPPSQDPTASEPQPDLTEPPQLVPSPPKTVAPTPDVPPPGAPVQDGPSVPDSKQHVVDPIDQGPRNLP